MRILQDPARDGGNVVDEGGWGMEKDVCRMEESASWEVAGPSGLEAWTGLIVIQYRHILVPPSVKWG